MAFSTSPAAEELLKKRYGQSRFNPAAGQTQMSLQEWLDLHPALNNLQDPELNARYAKATSAEGGQGWQSAASHGTPGAWQTYQGPASGTADRLSRIKKGMTRAAAPDVAAAPTFPADKAKQQDEFTAKLGGPDKPPARAGAGGYKNYLKTTGKSSSAEVGAAYRRLKGQPLTAAQKKKLGTKSEH